MAVSNTEMCRLCGEMAQTYDLSTILNILARNITKIMGVKGSTVRLLDEKSQTLEIVAAYGLSKTYLKKGPVILKNHPVDQKVLKGKVIKTKDITKKPHVLYLKDAKKEGIKSVLSVPLIAEDRPIGVIRVYTSTPHDFTAGEIERLRLLNEERRTLKVRAAYGLSKAYLEKGPIELRKSFIDRECLKCKVVSVPNIKKDKRLQYPEEITKEGIMALLSLPLVVRGSAIGVLRVY